MKQNSAALIVALMAFSAVLAPGRNVTSPSPPPGAAANSKPAETVPAKPAAEGKETAAVATHWQEPIRLYREFFGISFEDPKPDGVQIAERPSQDTKYRKEYAIVNKTSDEPDVSGPEDLREIAEQARAQRYDLKFMIALVPDPVDSSLAAYFDQALEAVQLAFASSGYLLDRVWIPWSGDADKNQLKTYRTTPGVLLFRSNPKITATGCLERAKLQVVFLVGETPKQGIHERAFDQSVSFIAGLSAAAASIGVAASPVRILGPTFSGSARSLRVAVSHWKPPKPFHIVSGTATAPGTEKDLGFERTLVSDDVLQANALGFLEHIGWDPSKIALLKEFDTSYGAGVNSQEGKAQQPLEVLFPSGLSEIRTAWEKNAKVQAANGDKNVLNIPQSALELSLEDQSKPVDIIPHFSSLSIDSSDLAISNLLERIWRDGIRYVGILSTDPRDKIFLVERIRRFCPDMLVFTLDNNLLYSHPQYSDKMDGTLVLSSFPLMTETHRFRGFLDGPSGRDFARQFTSELEEGIYNTTLSLLSDKKVREPRTWISAVGAGSLWPIAALPELHGLPFEKLANRDDLQFLALIATLCLLAVWLRSVYPNLDLVNEGGGIDPTAKRLLVLGSAVLCLTGALLVVLGTLPLWASSFSWEPDPQDGIFQVLYLAALLGAYIFLVWISARMTRLPGQAAQETANLLAWLLLGALLLLVLAPSLHFLWMPGGAEFFNLRGRKLSNGLSPAVAFCLLMSAFYFWVLLELKRRRMIALQAIAWPLQAHLEPPLAGTSEMAKPLGEALWQTLPEWRCPFHWRSLSRGQKFWLLFIVLIFPAAIRLLRAVQPICERRPYGQIFLVVALVAFGLCVISFYQFLSLWLALEKLLQRLDNSRLVKAFERVAAEINWKPMKSFWWQLTTFKMLVISTDRLRQIDRRSSYQAADLMAGIDGHLNAMFEADRTGDVKMEAVARRGLNEAFFAASCAFAPDAGDPEIEEFFAVRVVAYLRPFIGHMRNCITAALLSGLLLLFAVRSYAFEPKWFLSAMIWSFLSVVILVTLWVFVQMDQNATLSAIGGTPPGKVTLDRHLLTNILVYGAIPVIGILLTQFPGAGKFFAGWFNPLLQIVSLR